MLPADAERLVAVGRLEHRVPLLVEDVPREPPHLGLVLHEEHRLGAMRRRGSRPRRRRVGSAGASTRGSSIVNVAPCPGSLSTRMAPPVCVTMP